MQKQYRFNGCHVLLNSNNASRFSVCPPALLPQAAAHLKPFRRFLFSRHPALWSPPRASPGSAGRDYYVRRPYARQVRIDFQDRRYHVLWFQLGIRAKILTALPMYPDGGLICKPLSTPLPAKPPKYPNLQALFSQPALFR
ncbi:hypothetical protein KFK09_025372 [Dendrobium nobile]|uniref:Uncharacterized protein n=1 Tax=Dendrobium nobile TaxID=94219 RepID=A0A8T3AHJ4_DENNO|nr:hypothetical protein KFK09_025372 [Dendrobium nobile]